MRNPRLRRTAQAFEKRVMMSSRAELFLIVEGRKIDRSYYDRILESCFGTTDWYKVRACDEIECNGKQGSGKSHALALYDFWLKEDELVQSVRDGKRVIAFALDRDFDDLSGARVESDHIIYTDGMDAEADVFCRSDVAKAASSAFSISRGALPSDVSDADSLFEGVIRCWREWIVLAIIGETLGIAFGYSQGPKGCGFDDLTDEIIRPVRSRLASDAIRSGRLEDHDAAAVRARRLLESAGKWRLVKGKWVARYAWHKVRSETTDVLEASVKADTVTKCALDTIDFGGSWLARYRHFVSALL